MKRIARKYVACHTLLIVGLLYQAPAPADYIATGPLKASSCKSYVLFGSCKTVTIVAVEKDGQLYEPRTRFQEVDDYDASKQECTMEVPRAAGLSIIKAAAQKVGQPSFFYKNGEGKLEKADIEKIKFKCRAISG